MLSPTGIGLREKLSQNLRSIVQVYMNVRVFYVLLWRDSLPFSRRGLLTGRFRCDWALLFRLGAVTLRVCSRYVDNAVRTRCRCLEE